MSTGRLVDLSPPRMTVTADKGFNFSAQDDAFIVQKKNHFQLTCEIQLDAIPRFVRRANDGTLAEIAYLQVNFYGVKSDIPSTQIKVEQSQADRSKKEFVPLRLDLNSKNQGPSFQVTVGRLHFAETTSNNMRKKGKPNPAQKYFQLVIALEAVIMNGVNKTCYDVARMASEKVIVRASNPGQFESDNEPPWNRDMSSDTVFHMGRVAINTEQGSEALTVHGNIQVSGQVMQPSDSRIKTVLKEVDPKEQLQNVNKLRIVQYKYKPEFLHQLPRQDRHSKYTQHFKSDIFLYNFCLCQDWTCLRLVSLPKIFEKSYLMLCHPMDLTFLPMAKKWMICSLSTKTDFSWRTLELSEN